MGNKVFQERVRNLRLNKSVSISDLAKALSVTTNRISMWERSGAIPRFDKLAALSKFFDVPIDYLLGNDAIESRTSEDIELKLLQKNLEKLDDENLRKAMNILRAAFGDIFDSRQAQ